MQDDEDSKSITVVDDLVQNHGWTMKNVGPPGQRLRLDVVGNMPNVEGAVFTHQLASDPSAPPVKIRDIFTTDREIFFSSVGLQPHSDYLRQRDQDGWKQYLIEGASPLGLTPDQVVDKWFRIIRCQFPDVTLQDESGRIFQFPLLVLADPDNVMVRESTRETDEPVTYGDFKGYSSDTQKPHPSYKSMWEEGGGESDTDFFKKVLGGVVLVIIVLMALIS